MLPFLWAVLFRELGWRGLIEIGIVLGILVVGLYHAQMKGALPWY